jgi:excisionase family DNA binding protein
MTELDVAQTAERLGVSERTIRRWLRDGRLVSYKVGGRIRIPERAVRDAAAPYGTREAIAPRDLSGDPATAAGDAVGAPLLAMLDDPVRRAAALRRRREIAAAKMDEIAARSRPPAGPHDTVDAYIREDRVERDRHWDEILGLHRP